MVVDFEGKKVQMPSDNGDEENIYIELQDNKFTVVSKEKYNSSLRPIKKEKTVYKKERVIDNE